MFYKVAVYFKGERIGVGEACSTKKAQFEAAQNALDKNQSRLFAFLFYSYMCGYARKLHVFIYLHVTSINIFDIFLYVVIIDMLMYYMYWYAHLLQVFICLCFTYLTVHMLQICFQCSCQALISYTHTANSHYGSLSSSKEVKFVGDTKMNQILEGISDDIKNEL